MNKFQLQKGFTLIELLIVITIIATLSVSVFVALNPAQRLRDTKDARRTSDVQSILTAIHTSIVDNGGNYPTNMPPAGTERMLGSGAACTLTNTFCTVGATCSDLMTGTLNLSRYMRSMPIDPIAGTTYTAARTGYTVQVDTNGIITVKACGTEGATLIQASR